MSKIVASADITQLDFSVLLDLSGAVPVASVTNLSTVVNPANLQWIFELTSPSGTTLYAGDFSDPDVDGTVFTTWSFPYPLQQIFGLVEYSNINEYVVKVQVKDDDGNIFDLSKGSSLCKPNGNNGRNNFGQAGITVEVRCGNAQLLIRDSTNLVYKSLAGQKVSTTATVTYPIDTNGNTLAAVTVNSLPALIPIKYEGEGHEVYAAHVYDYDLGDFFFVRIRYSFTKVFPVWCHVNLEPLFCEVVKIGAMLEKDCADNLEKRLSYQKLTLANTKLLHAAVGIIQPLSGVDVPGLIEEIKKLLVIECDCCRPQGISSVGTALATDAVYTASVTCGDITASFANDDAGNIVLTLADKSYTFAMSGDPLSSDAFSFVTTTVGCVKATVLRVSKEDLATEILTEIQTNITLLNILNGITQRAQLTCTGLDGGAAFDLTTSNYSMEINTVTVGKVLETVTINGVIHIAPGGLLVTNAAGVASYLNGLGLGVFVVVYTAMTNRTTITSAANVNALSTISTMAGSTREVIAFNNNNGLICTMLQMIFDYFNSMGLEAIKTGGDFTVCSFAINGSVATQAIADNATALSLATAMNDAICNIVNYTKDKLVTCDNIKNLFGTPVSTTGNPAPEDFVIGSQNGACMKMPLKNIALSIFQMLSTDTDVKSMYCLGAKCTTVSDCSPVAGLAASAGTTTTTVSWSTVAGAIGYKYSMDGVNWTFVGTTTAYLTGLTADSGYTIRVKPVYNSGDGDDCTVALEFVTLEGDPCEAPELEFSNLLSHSFRVAWTSVTGASGYQYRLNGGAWISVGLVLVTDVTGLNQDTLYTIEVRAIIGGTPCVLSTSVDQTTAEAINCISIAESNEVAGASIEITASSSSTTANSVVVSFSVTTDTPNTYTGTAIIPIHGFVSPAVVVNYLGVDVGELMVSIAITNITPASDVDYTYVDCAP